MDELRAAGCVFAEDEAALLADAARSAAELRALLARRVVGEPLETILGWVDFGGRRLVVRPRVFVPRRRTEFLAELARTATPDGGVFVELCCGVAPVAALVGGRAQVFAADIDPVATACAGVNAPTATVATGDLYAPLPATLRGAVDVIAANAPYVPTAAIALMPPEAREHEPHATLDGGADGLDLHRLIAAAAPAWLRPSGRLFIETSDDQADRTAALMAAAGLTAHIERDPDRDATVAVGLRRRPTLAHPRAT
ncbi:putative protein N(5)-glutamine methyltransferase [Tsukamurella soli]|uniref:Release factor glutamine methyltransferase n=1 Tax=Tsukamurella soli TaxID=644556 RepID=A0ABP8KGI5_9ACTN